MENDLVVRVSAADVEVLRHVVERDVVVHRLSVGPDRVAVKPSSNHDRAIGRRVNLGDILLERLGEFSQPDLKQNCSSIQA